MNHDYDPKILSIVYGKWEVGGTEEGGNMAYINNIMFHSNFVRRLPLLNLWVYCNSAIIVLPRADKLENGFAWRNYWTIASSSKKFFFIARTRDFAELKLHDALSIGKIAEKLNRRNGVSFYYHKIYARTSKFRIFRRKIN